MASHIRTSKAWQLWIISICLVGLMSTMKPADSLKIPNLLSAAFGVGSPSSSVKNQQQQSQMAPSASSAAAIGVSQQQAHASQLYQTPSTQQAGSGRFIAKPFQSLLPSRHHALLFNSLPKSLFGRLTASSSSPIQSSTGSAGAASQHQLPVYNLPLLMHYHKKMKSLGLGGKAPQPFSPLSSNTDQIRKLPHGQQGIDMDDYVDLAALLQQQQQLAIKPIGSRYPYGPDGSSNSNVNNNKAHSVPHHLIAMNSVPVAQQLNTIRSPQTQQQKVQPHVFLSSLNNQGGNQLQQQSQLQSVNNHPKVIQQQQQPSVGSNGKQQLLGNSNLKDDSKTIEDIGMLVDEELRKLELNVTNNHQHKELFPDLFINGTILKNAIENSIAEENLNRNISLLSVGHHASNPTKQTKQLAQPTKSVNVTELVSVATNQQQLMNSNVKKNVNIDQANIVQNVTTLPIKSSADVSPSVSGVVDQDKSKPVIVEPVGKQKDTNVFQKEIVSADSADAARAISAPSQQHHHLHENMETSATASNVARMNAIAAGLDDAKIEKFILGPYKGPHIMADQQHHQQQHLFPMSQLDVNYPIRAQHLIAEQKGADKTLLTANTNNYNHFYHHQQQPALSHIFYPPQHASSNMDFMLDLNNNGNIHTKQQQDQQQAAKSPHQPQQQHRQQLHHQQDQKLYGNKNNNNDNSNRINQLDHHRHHQHHHHHQMMRETNPTAIVELTNPVHMLYQQQQQQHLRTGGGQSTHQHQIQHQQMVAPKGNNEALVNMHRQYNQAQRQQRQPLASTHHHQQQKFVDSPYRLETNNNNDQQHNDKQHNSFMVHNQPKVLNYLTDADNNKPNNVVNNQKMFHGHYQHQPTQHITMANGSPAFFDASTGTLIDFGAQADSDNQPDLSDNSINAYMQQQQQQQSSNVNSQPLSIQMEQTGNSRYAVPMNHMGQPQQTTTFTQYTVPLLHHTQQKQTYQQQQPSVTSGSDTTGYYSTIVINHNVPSNDQQGVAQSSKFKSGLYQIDPPKLINGTTSNYEQAQSGSQNGFENGYGPTQSNTVADINSTNDTKQASLISEPERANYQLQDSQSISQEENQKEENGDQNGNIPQSQINNNFTFVKQVEATIGVGQQQNKLHQQLDDSLSGPVKGKVFNEPLFASQQQQNDQDQAIIDNGSSQNARPHSNEYQGEGIKGSSSKVRHPSPLTGGRKAEEYKMLRQQQQQQQQQQQNFESTPGYEQQQAILSSTAPSNSISSEASTTAQSDAIDANNQHNQYTVNEQQQIRNTKQQPLLETEVYTIPYTIHHHQKPDQNGFITQNQANQVENIFNGGQHGKHNQQINHYQTSQDNSLRQYPAFSPSLLSTIYHSRQQQQAPRDSIGSYNNNRLNDQQAQHAFDQQQSFMKTILSNDYNQQRLPQTLIEWKPPTVSFLNYGENNQQQPQQEIEFAPNNNQGHPSNINNNMYLQSPEHQQQQQANFVRNPMAQESSSNSNSPQQQQFLFAIHHNQIGVQQQKHAAAPSTTVPTTSTSTTTAQSLPTTIQQLPETVSNGYDQTISPPPANVADFWNGASPRPPTGAQLANVQQYQQQPIGVPPHQQQQQAFEQSTPIIESDGQGVEDINGQHVSDQQQPLKQATSDVQSQKQDSDSFHNDGQVNQPNSEPIFTQFSRNNNNENKSTESSDDDDDQQTTNQQQQLDIGRPSSINQGLHGDIQHQDIQRATQQQRQQFVEAMDSQVQAPPSPFFCANRSPGLYADESQKCKVYYQCGPTGQQQFKCGNQTQFNQKTLTCDWWYNVDCSSNQSQQKIEALTGPSEDHFGISDQSHQRITNTGEQPSFTRPSSEQQNQDVRSQQQDTVTDQDQARKPEFDASIRQENNREQQQRDLDSDTQQSQSSSNKQVSFVSSGQLPKQSNGWDALNSFLASNSNDNNDDHQQQHQNLHVQQQYQEDVKSAPYDNKQQEYTASLRPEMFHHSESQSNTTVSTVQPLPQMIVVPPSSPASQPLYYVTSIPSTWSSNTNVIHHQQPNYHKPSITNSDPVTSVQATEPSISLTPTLPSTPQVGAILSDEGVVSSSSSSPDSNTVGGHIENRSGQQQPNQVSTIHVQQEQQQQQNSARFPDGSNAVNQDQQQLSRTISSPVEPISQLPVSNQDVTQAKSDNDMIQQQQLNVGAARTDVKQSDRSNNEDSSSPSSIQSDSNKGSASDKQRPQEENDFGGAKSRRLANQPEDQQQTVISTKSEDTKPLSVIFDSTRTSATIPVTATNTDQQQRQPAAHRYSPTRLSANSNDRSQQQISLAAHTYSGGSFATNGGESVYSAGNNQGSVSYTPTDVHYLTAKGLATTVDQNDSSSSKLLSKASATEQNNSNAAELSSSQSNQEQTPSRSNSSSSSNNKLDRRYGQRLSMKTANATVAQKKSSA